MVYDLILENKEFLKIIYALIICFVCSTIILKTDRLFKLSGHQGIRYFRNAFLFYGIAFFVRFILGAIPNPILSYEYIYPFLIEVLFEFSIVMAGFFLFYSLIWRKIEKDINYNSLFNLRIGLFYIITLLIVFLDYLLITDILMYTSQIALFLVMSIISYTNYIRNGKTHKFLKFYFIAMIIGLLAWLLNATLYYFLEWNKVVQMQAYGLNIIFFLVFLYGIIKFTKTKNG